MIDQRIIRFIRKHHVMTLATADAEGAPYCSHAFYCYDESRNLLIFAANDDTRHGCEMTRQPRVAAAIALETRVVGKLQGVQLCGTVSMADGQARSAYFLRFPFAAVASPRLWVITPDFMKFTDNTLGFGKKLIWNTPESSL